MLRIILVNQLFALENSISIGATLLAHALYETNLYSDQAELPEGLFNTLSVEEIKSAAPILFAEHGDDLRPLLEELARARVIEVPSSPIKDNKIFYRFGEKYDEYFLY
jgi:hypothetical protein